MNRVAKALLITIGIIVGSPVAANSYTNTFAECMVDTLNGKERKKLAKWIFFSIAAHPEINSYSSATSNDIDESDRYVGKLITRLLADDCPGEFKLANRSDPRAIQKAFELVGQIAMQELMANQQVMETITNYAKYADQEKISTVLSEK